MFLSLFFSLKLVGVKCYIDGRMRLSCHKGCFLYCLVANPENLPSDNLCITGVR